MVQTSMLSTIDNPFNPFDDFTSWYLYDISKGYNCSERVARIANLSDDLTESEANEAVEKAIDDLIVSDPLGLFVKVKMNSEQNTGEQ